MQCHWCLSSFVVVVAVVAELSWAVVDFVVASLPTLLVVRLNCFCRFVTIDLLNVAVDVNIYKVALFEYIFLLTNRSRRLLCRW